LVFRRCLVKNIGKEKGEKEEEREFEGGRGRVGSQRNEKRKRKNRKNDKVRGRYTDRERDDRKRDILIEERLK